MSAKIICLAEWRELLQRIEAEALEDPRELLNFYELDMAMNEGLIWMDLARSFVYQPLYCIQGGKKKEYS
jgi:hypothetical protein